MKEYDVIASLGGGCAVAFQLQHRGLRPFALPFDWTRMPDAKPVRYLIRGFADDFKDLCLKKNLSSRIEKPLRGRDGRIEYEAFDNFSGFDFLHLFSRPFQEQGAYDAGNAVLRRRIGRFVSSLAKAKSALLILQTGFAFDNRLAVELAESIRCRFPNLDLALHIMQFSAADNSEITIGNGIRILRYHRELDMLYDMVFTSIEWRFLDSVKLTGIPLPGKLKPDGLMRCRYALWKRFGLELEKRGYGCCNMRFWNYDNA